MYSCLSARVLSVCPSLSVCQQVSQQVFLCLPVYSCLSARVLSVCPSLSVCQQVSQQVFLGLPVVFLPVCARVVCVSVAVCLPTGKPTGISLSTCVFLPVCARVVCVSVAVCLPPAKPPVEQTGGHVVQEKVQGCKEDPRQHHRPVSCFLPPRQSAETAGYLKTLMGVGMEVEKGVAAVVVTAAVAVVVVVVFTGL